MAMHYDTDRMEEAEIEQLYLVVGPDDQEAIKQAATTTMTAYSFLQQAGAPDPVADPYGNMWAVTGDLMRSMHIEDAGCWVSHWELYVVLSSLCHYEAIRGDGDPEIAADTLRSWRQMYEWALDDLDIDGVDHDVSPPDRV